MNDDLRRRAAVHAALGDPTRLAIVDDLRRSDRSPSELADRFDLSSNLLAHHLDVLAEVGLIERTESSGDRRRRYVRLADLPDLDPVGAPFDGPIVFVCTRNSARSQLAAALWVGRTGGVASSAGTHPADAVHPGAVAAARRHGLDLAGIRPRLLDPADVVGQVVTVCDRAHEELDPAPDWWHWSVPDPVEIGTDEAFDAAVDELSRRISST